MDGSRDAEAASLETDRFAIDGTEYEIDLTAAHAAELREHPGSYAAQGCRLGIMTRGWPLRVDTYSSLFGLRRGGSALAGVGWQEYFLPQHFS